MNELLTTLISVIIVPSITFFVYPAGWLELLLFEDPWGYNISLLLWATIIIPVIAFVIWIFV